LLFGVRLALPILPPLGLERVAAWPSIAVAALLFGLGAWLGRASSLASDDVDNALRSVPRKNDPTGFTDTWREAAVNADLLPVYSDWETCFAITREADVVYSDGSWSNAKRLANPRYRHIVFAQAAARYPEFTKLRPLRQPSDPDCPSCHGTGRVRVGDTTYDDMICECGGLGWIPKGTALEQL